MNARSRPVSAALAALLLPMSLLAQEPESWVGSWQGELSVGPQVLPLLFHIGEGPAGLVLEVGDDDACPLLHEPAYRPRSDAARAAGWRCFSSS